MAETGPPGSTGEPPTGGPFPPLTSPALSEACLIVMNKRAAPLYQAENEAVQRDDVVLPHHVIENLDALV